LSGYGNNTYNIYIRFQYIDAETQSRMFWNPSGTTEFAQSIQTRRQANWSLRVELASPGTEWVQIGTVQVVAGVIGGAGIVDMRNFYFEGAVNGSYASGWGSANDRTATRSGQYGLKDLQQFTAAVRQLFEDLRPTGGRWWEKRGLKATGLAASNEPGVSGIADGSGAGVLGTASGAHNSSVGLSGIGSVAGAATTSNGISGLGAGTDGHGVAGTGAGTGPGVKGVGGATGAGLEGVGGATSGVGVDGTGTNGNAHGVQGVPHGSGSGVKGIASGANNSSVGVEGVGDVSGAATTSNGISGTGAGTDGHGVVGQGAAAGPGVLGTGGATAGAEGVEGVGGSGGGGGVWGTATGDYTGVTGKAAAASNGYGVIGEGRGTGAGIYGDAYGTGPGAWGDASNGAGYGVIAQAVTNPTVTGRASLQIVPQTGVPATLDNGAMWIQTDTNLAYIRINGVTKTFAFV
jgi:hypothetical protein